jgi:hypothetical protein
VGEVLQILKMMYGGIGKVVQMHVEELFGAQRSI